MFLREVAPVVAHAHVDKPDWTQWAIKEEHEVGKGTWQGGSEGVECGVDLINIKSTLST